MGHAVDPHAVALATSGREPDKTPAVCAKREPVAAPIGADAFIMRIETHAPILHCVAGRDVPRVGVQHMPVVRLQQERNHGDAIGRRSRRDLRRRGVARRTKVIDQELLRCLVASDQSHHGRTRELAPPQTVVNASRFGVHRSKEDRFPTRGQKTIAGALTKRRGDSGAPELRIHSHLTQTANVGLHV